MKDSISSFLSMQAALVLRRNQLNELKNASTARSYEIYGTDRKTVTEPTYDIKVIDKKLTDINKALFMLDSKIKAANATTDITIDIDFDKLMSELA